MIWNTSDLSVSHLGRATAIFVVDRCQFGPNYSFGLKLSLWPVPDWLAVQLSKAVFFLTLHVSINDLIDCITVCIITQPCHSHFCCWLLPIWPLLGFGLKMELMTCADLVGATTSKTVFFLTLHVSINDMKHFLTVCITPQPCHSSVCCWLLPILP